MNVCGLDFGTSNSAVALPTGEVLPIDPAALQPRLFRSVLFFPEETREVFAGHEAISQYLDDNAGRFIQSVKTWLPSTSFESTQIRGAVLKLEDLIAIVLRRIREEASRRVGAAIDGVLLGRPARFSADPEIDAMAQARLERAARVAGFREVGFLIEPVAAALAYEATLERDEQVLVADFGAGTSDFTLMRLGPSRRTAKDRRGDIIASAGVYVGGDRFDSVIMRSRLLRAFGQDATYKPASRRMPMPQYVFSRLLSWNEMSFNRDRPTRELIELALKTTDQPEQIEALHDLVMHNLGYHLFRAIERAKIELSSREETRLDFELDRVRLHERISRAEFERESLPLIRQLEACTDQVLAAAPGVEVDSVFLTGGSSQIPAVRALFSRRFGEDRLRTADAFTSVVEGLGRATAAGFLGAAR